MLNLKSLFLLSSALLMSTACSKLNFVAEPVSCETPATSAKFGVSGPLILFPTIDTVVGGKVTVSGSCVSGYPVEIKEATGEVTSVPCTAGAFSKEIILSTGDGTKDLLVSQKTAAGGGESVDRLCFLKDTVPPAVTISSGNSAQSSNSTSTVVTGTCEAGLDVVIGGPGVVTPVTTACNNGSFTATVQIVTGDGNKDIIGTQVDRAGNQGLANSDVNLDTTAPNVRITSAIPTVTNLSSIAVTGVCENGIPVEIGQLRNTIAPAVSCVNGTFSATIPLPGADGPVAARVFQVDLAGNLGLDTKNLLKDTVAPVVTITSPLANAYLPATSTFSGACESGINVELSGSVLTAARTVACTSGQWTLNVAIAAGQGAKALTAAQTDAAGNRGQAQQNFQVDTVAPVLAFTSPAANAFVSASFVVTGTCETGLTVQVAGAGILPSTSTLCANGTFSVLVNASPLDGTKLVTAAQTDAAGNSGNTSRSFVRDSLGPVLTITSPSNNSYVGASFLVSGTCESGLTVSFSGAGIASAGSVVCANNGTYSLSLTTSAGDGAKAITASETDSSGNSSSASGSYLRDATAPAVVITSPAANTVGGSSLVVGGTCETGLNVTLAGSGVSAAVVTPCASAAFSATVNFTAGSGTKLVTASQTDAAGNIGTDSRNFVSDLTPPTITITAPAANSYLPTTFAVTGACETGFNVTVAGAGVASSVVTSCTAGAYSANMTVSSGEGSKVVTASQTDNAGNVASASRTFLRDTVAPVLTITSPANGTTAQNGITLVGTCEAGLTVSFSGPGVSAASSIVCATNGTYSSALTFSAGDGAKTINLSEADAAGNTTQISGSFNRDTTAPLVAITSPAADTTAQNGLTVGGTCETGLNVTLSGAVTANVVVPCNAGVFSGDILFNAGAGSKTITASQTDAVGNVGTGSRNFIRDNVGPAVTITAPAANSYLPASFTVTGACENGFNVTVGGAGVATPVVVACSSAAYSANVNVSAGEGAKVVTATQTDGAGNVGTASRSFLRDTVAPVLTISSPANGTTAQNGITITGTCEAGLTVSFSGAGVASSSSVTCASNGTYSAGLSFSAGDGAKSVNVSETDAAGNNSQVTGSFNRDATAPLVAITSPAADTTAQTGLTVGGTCESGLNVTLSGAVASNVVVACNSGVFSGDILFSAGNGSKTITASQTDAVGNTGSGSRNFIRDNVGPAVTITSPAANSYVASSFVIAGACETGLNVTLAGAGLSAPVSAACTASAYSATVSVSSGDGAKAVTASQTDLAGNVGSASRSFLRDGTAPVITITSPAAGASVPTSATLTGTCETGLTVSVTGAITSTSGACTNGAYSINIVFSAGLGTKAVQVQQTDAAGNVGQASSSFLRDSNAGSETFVSDAKFGNIDILFIDDNSASMDPNQASLGTKFSGFATELLNINWQIGITTTDCSAGPYGICGSLLDLTGTSSKILTPSTPSYQTVFNNSIQRPETAGCLNTGTCPAGASEPLLAATTAMNKFNSTNSGFFRSNADLAIVILSDADERQTGGATYASRPQDLINAFNTNWPSGKKLKVYSIIVKPGDATCLATMRAQSNGFSFYGDLVDQTVNLTSGLSSSICAPDYSVTLKSIGESVRTLTNSVELAHTPVAGSVSVTFTPNQNITYKVIGNKVVFDSPPSAGTEIKVDYQY
jgi:hypothetical protein